MTPHNYVACLQQILKHLHWMYLADRMLLTEIIVQAYLQQIANTANREPLNVCF